MRLGGWGLGVGRAGRLQDETGGLKGGGGLWWGREWGLRLGGGLG